MRARYHRILAVLGFFTLAAGDFWRYLLSWWGWGAIVVVLIGLAIIEAVRARPDLRRLPLTLIGFLAVATLSITWAANPATTALGVAALLATTAFPVFLVSCLTLPDIVGALSTALRWILGLSLVFEFIVAAVIRERVLPLWVDWSHLDRIPAAFYWSRAHLFDGDRIQGIVGNSNLLAMVALIGLVVFVARLAAGVGSRLHGWLWVAVAVLTLALTRSTTILVAAAAVAVAAGVVLLVRPTRGRRRLALTATAVGAVVAAAALAVAFRAPLLALAGKSDDLTHRLDIWDTVLGLVGQRPAGGWGWVGYWPPWAEPYRDLVVINGVPYFQAHNAWLDVLLQVGVVGLVAFSLFVLATVVGTWRDAVDTEPTARPGGALAAISFLLVVLLLVQSLAESRLLIEIGWALLVLAALVAGRPLVRGRGVGA